MIELEDANCPFFDRLTHGGRFIAVSFITANFKGGGRYIIVGESDFGKATLARMIAGPQRPSIGAISVDGPLVYERIRAGKEHFEKVQITQQNSASALDPKLPIGRPIEEPLLCFFQMGKIQRRERCRQLMELCNLLGDYYAWSPSKLSGGRQKRVTIARALATEPQCLIFDEATDGLDLPLRKKIIDKIADLRHQLSFMLILVTRDMELAVMAVDEIFAIRGSNLVEHTIFSGDYSVFQNPYSRMSLKVSGLTEAPSDQNNKMEEGIILQWE